MMTHYGIEKLAALSTKQKLALGALALGTAGVAGGAAGVAISNIHNISEMDKWRAQRNIDKNTNIIKDIMIEQKNADSLANRAKNIRVKVDQFYDI